MQRYLALFVIAAYQAIPSGIRARRFGSNGASTRARKAIRSGAPPLKVLWAYGRPRSYLALVERMALGTRSFKDPEWRWLTSTGVHDWGWRPSHTMTRPPSEWNLWCMSVDTRPRNKLWEFRDRW